MSGTTMKTTTPEDIEIVLRAWSHDDDWNISSISTDIAMRLIRRLDRGASATRLAAHAGHVGADCRRERWDECAPETLDTAAGQAEADRELMEAESTARRYGGSCKVCGILRDYHGRTTIGTGMPAHDFQPIR